MGLLKHEKILILAKTYPSPSARHIETSCVAGITTAGEMRRLYPIPFRLIESNRKFNKWQWVEMRIEKAASDHRPESYKVDVGTLCPKDKILTQRNWTHRRPWLDKIPSFSSIESLNEAREKTGHSIALIRPKEILGLEIRKAKSLDWSMEEKEKLQRAQMQGHLFTEDQAKKDVKELRKVPYDFYYSYTCQTAEGNKRYTHKIVDWEAAGLYWNVINDHGPNSWEEKFREMMESNLMGKDLMFLMGNQHRFQDQWLIISLIYPPKHKPLDDRQMFLL